jgi:hypothetical protein
VGDIRGDAGVWEEIRGPDHEPLGGGGDGRDRVAVVERIEFERPRVARDLVRLVPARGARAERVRDCDVAAVGTAYSGGGAPGAH